MAKKIFGNEIGIWTELKLKCIKKYLGAYSNILNCGGFPKYYFIDTFAGSGWCKTRKTRKLIYGSPLIALSIDPPFTKYFFIELDETKTIELKKTIEERFPKMDVVIEQGDCNVKIDSILNQIGDNMPFVTLLDPQAGDLYWKTIDKISQKKKAEVLINFPFGMAIVRYMPLTRGKTITQNMKERLDRIFGDKRWREIYSERKRGTISSALAREKYLDLYLNNLSTSFKYYAVKNIRNTLGNNIYYLIFGGKNIKGLEKIKDVIVKNEPERNTLFFLQDLTNKIYKIFSNEKNLTLKRVLEKLLPGKHLYRKQDFKKALKILEKEGRLKRVKPRKYARSFRDDELFHII